ncbi:AMP-binding protein [Rhodococcus sp. P1Y]|uniref:AMP-binding protein n=1 Tax=Rhodococcus sp. P1Y TaxID=1302308 RepID=UPI0013798B71|nr:AMP-binding protein [Rhodococcus sp. P1Y]
MTEEPTCPTVTQWLTAPVREAKYSFSPDGTSWQKTSHKDLAEQANGAASYFTLNGVRPGDRVGLIVEAGPNFIAAFFGAILIGAIPAPIATPPPFGSSNNYLLYLRNLIHVGQLDIIVCGETARSTADLATDALTARVLPVQGSFDKTAPVEPHGFANDDLCLIQFSSGSSGTNRAVHISHQNLAVNTQAIAHWLELGRGDSWATWLPHYHDMGLIGGILTPLVSSIDIMAMAPQTFIKNPAGWLSCFGEYEATVTACPNFALDFILRRVNSNMVLGHDYSRWKSLVCGAERVDHQTMTKFANRFGVQGFNIHTCTPAYGLAESTLAVTGKKLKSAPRSITVRASSLSPGSQVHLGPAGADEVRAIVSCGQPVDPNSCVWIEHDGHSVPEGVVGEVHVKAASVAVGYSSTSRESTNRFEGGKVNTGDAGFLLQGELFVVGRFGDSVKVRGRTFFSEDVDAVLFRLTGVDSHNLVSILGDTPSGPAILVVTEVREVSILTDIRNQLTTHFAGLTIQVAAVDKGSIMRTTSGKPRRRAMWDAYATDTTDGNSPPSTSLVEAAET